VTYVLDTNALSALMKGSAAVVDRLAATARTDVAIPQPVIAEITFGIERLPRSKRRAALQARLDFISAELPRAEWTDAVSRMFGRIKHRSCFSLIDQIVRQAIANTRAEQVERPVRR
jgi:predicted nucleic acid-binding protein